MKAETALFRLRFDSDSAEERQRFLESLNFDWQPVGRIDRGRARSTRVEQPHFPQVSVDDKKALRDELTAANPSLFKTFDSETFYRVSGLCSTACRSLY